MILDIVGANASWGDNGLHIAFDVVPEGGAHLDLKTGEVFQSDSYTKLHQQSDRAIAGTLFVTRHSRSASGAELPSEMRYITGKAEWGPQIYLIWRLPDDELARFHSLILGGNGPRKAVIFFPHDKLEFGWEPDGSGQKWDNEKTAAVPIDNVRFDQLSLKESANVDQPWNEQVPEEYDRKFFADSAKVNFALMRKLSVIETSLVRLYWIVGLIGIVMLAFVLWRFPH